MSASPRRIGTGLLLAAACAVALRASAAQPLDPGWETLLKGGDPSRAAQVLQGRLDKDPSDAAASYGLALLLQAQGHREKAMVTAVEGLKNAPSDPLAFLLQELISQDATFNLATTRLLADSIPLLTAQKDMDPLVRFNLRWVGYRLAARQPDAAVRLEAKTAAGFLPGAFFSEAETELSRTRFFESSPGEKGALSAHRWTYRELPGVEVRPPAYSVPGDREFNYLILVPFRVPAETEALLFFNGAKSFRVVLDDRVLFTKDVFKVQENPTSVRKVRLAPGDHRLLVKVHASREGDGIHMALLDAEGNPLNAELGSKDLAAPKPAGFADLGEFMGFFPRSFPTDDPRWPGFHALWNEWMGDVARSRLEMEDAADASPGGLAWNLVAARMYLFDSDDLPQKIAQSRSERVVERAVAAAGDLPLLLYYRALLEGENSDADEDLAILRDLARDHTTDPRWALTLAQRLQGKGWNGLAREVLKEASSYQPECESVESAWVAFYQQLPDPASQEQAIRRLEKLRNADPEWEDYYGSTRQWEALKATIQKESERYGDYDKHYEAQLARVELRMGDYASARSRLEALVRLEPDDPDAAFQHARCLFLMGDREGGFKAWEEIKRRKPEAFQVDLARMALGEPWPFQERALSLERVLKENSGGAPDQAPSSLLLDQMFTRVEPDGSSLERYHGIIRINDKEGVDREGEQSLPGQVILSVRTVKPDGRILEPEQIPEKDTISLQGLEPGDLVEFEYITLRPPSGVKPNAYVTNQVFVFQDIEKPFHRTQWYLEYPESIPMQFEERNLPSPGVRGSKVQERWVDWDYRSMPRIAREPDTPNRQLFVPLVEAVGGITWKDVARFLKEGVTGSFQITPELERRYEDAVGDARTPQAKLDGIVRYLLKEVDGENETSWQDPTQTLMTRQGSRIPVAMAFLELAGIPHRLLIAEAVPDKAYREALPRLGQFRFPVLEVDLPGAKPRFYTLGSPYRDPAILGWFLQGASAWPVTDPEPWREVTISKDFAPWAQAEESEVRELQPNGDLRLEHSGALDPEAEESLRSTFHKMASDQWKRVIQMSLAKRYGNADLLDYGLEGLEDAERRLDWTYSIVIKGFASEDGGRLTVPDPLPALQLGQAYASLKERKLPLSTGGPIFISQGITFKLPPGYALDFPLADVDLKTDFGRYRLASRKEADGVHIERRLEIPYQIIWPQQYPKFAQFLRAIDQAESVQMVVARP